MTFRSWSFWLTGVLILTSRCAHHPAPAPLPVNAGSSASPASQAVQNGLPHSVPKGANPLANADLIDLSLAGLQTEAQFSPSGEKLIYISWERTAHKNQQVYEYDLVLKKERRLTYLDGLATTPGYWNEEIILYSSNTDEMKDNVFKAAVSGSATVQTADSYRMATEIYLSDFLGDNILRLTNRPGLDQNAVKDPWTSDGLFFISLSPSPGIYSLKKGSSLRKKLLSGLFEGFVIDKSLRSLMAQEKFKEDHTRLIRFDLRSHKEHQLPSPSDKILTFATTPWEGLLLLAEPSDAEETQLSFWNPLSQCLSAWKKLPGRATHLQGSPKGDGQFVISLKKNQDEKIFLLKAPDGPPPCANLSTSDKIK